MTKDEAKKQIQSFINQTQKLNIPNLDIRAYILSSYKLNKLHREALNELLPN